MFVRKSHIWSAADLRLDSGCTPFRCKSALAVCISRQQNSELWCHNRPKRPFLSAPGKEASCILSSTQLRCFRSSMATFIPKKISLYASSAFMTEYMTTSCGPFCAPKGQTVSHWPSGAGLGQPLSGCEEEGTIHASRLEPIHPRPLPGLPWARRHLAASPRKP